MGIVPSAPAPSIDLLRVLASGTAAATGDEFFRSLARHAAEALGAKYAFVAETVSELESRSLAYWEGSGFGEGFSYRFPGTPCQRVAQGHVCSTATDLQRLFPEDLWLQQIGVDSYIGVPLQTHDSKVLGHIAVLDTRPMQVSPEQLAALQIFAARGCAELARVQADRALHAALAEVRRLRDRLHEENVYLQDEIRSEHNFGDIVGSSAPIRRLLAQIDLVAASDSTVLISGETGTGKELVARALHDRSARREHPLVKVNCGAISPALVESELFGHVKGAFTGAVGDRVGRFELADGGTLFLDEIGELPLDLQVKLLRALQEQEFEPVGSSRTVRVDARVIAATNRDLEAAAAAGRFRQDLFYRLNVIPLRVPALRDRREDITPLAFFFLERAARKIGQPVRGIATTTLELLKTYDWPGNVRELQNVIERAVVMSSGAVLELDPRWLESSASVAAPRGRSTPARTPAVGAGPRSAATAGRTSLAEVERQHILEVLERSGWVIEGENGAARSLGLKPSTIRSRMKKLGIARAPGG